MADEDSVASQPDAELNGHEEASAGRRVVVVNDAPAVLALYRDMLEELNFEPVMMATEAIETDRIRQANPDAVLLDLTVGLQAEYGVQMARELRADERYASIPIVVATANADALDGSRQTLELIGVPILLKPFTVEELGTSLAADDGAEVNAT